MNLPDWQPFSWEELRTLHYLWKCQHNLLCEGSTWSIYGKYRLAAGRSTVDSLADRGCIRPAGKYNDPAHDDYELTPFGQHWAEQSEADFLAQLEQRIEEEMPRKVLPSPTALADTPASEPEFLSSKRRRSAVGRRRRRRT